MKIKKSHLKELVRQSIYDNISEYKEDIKESKRRRFTVKEVQKWMKTLEENRYKKVYNSDCRRVAWMVNNMNEDVTNMPKSMSKKWTKAQYGRERYLAKEFIKSKKQQMAEGKLREVIREILKEQLNEAKFKKVILPNDKRTQNIVSKMIKQMKLKIDKDYDVKVTGSGTGKNRQYQGTQKFSILPKHYNKFIELAMQHKLNPRG